jgi:alpha-D-ribose 1-methylphosphonate 5-triphosphate synthase subunit PhnH
VDPPDPKASGALYIYPPYSSAYKAISLALLLSSTIPSLLGSDLEKKVAKKSLGFHAAAVEVVCSLYEP